MNFLNSTHPRRSRRPPLVILPLLAILLTLTPTPSLGGEGVDPADPTASFDYEDQSQENYRNMDKDNYQNADDYNYQDDDQLKYENENQADYQNEDSKDYQDMNQLDYKAID